MTNFIKKKKFVILNEKNILQNKNFFYFFFNFKIFLLRRSKHRLDGHKNCKIIFFQFYIRRGIVVIFANSIVLRICLSVVKKNRNWFWEILIFHFSFEFSKRKIFWAACRGTLREIKAALLHLASSKSRTVVRIASPFYSFDKNLRLKWDFLSKRWRVEAIRIL